MTWWKRSMALSSNIPVPSSPACVSTSTASMSHGWATTVPHLIFYILLGFKNNHSFISAHKSALPRPSDIQEAFLGESQIHRWNKDYNLQRFTNSNYKHLQLQSSISYTLQSGSPEKATPLQQQLFLFMWTQISFGTSLTVKPAQYTWVEIM